MYLKIKTEHHGIWEKTAKAVKAKIARLITEQMPVSFGLEPSNACNANCTFCAYQFQERVKGIMSMDVFKRAIDEFCIMGGGDINFTPTVGDPLVDRELLEKIKYARSQKRVEQIWFYTNMIAFNTFNPEEFVKSGITSLRISTCIKDKETYQKIYRSPKYEQMINNIVALCEANEHLGSPIKILLFLRVPKPIEEVYASPDYKRVTKYFQKDNVIALDDEYDSWGGLIDEQDLPAGHRLYENPLDQAKEPCSELFRRINILNDGTVNNCVCRDLNATMKIGNIKEQTIEQIWKGEPLKKLRQDWFNGEVPKTCQGCQRYLPVSDYYASQFRHIVKTFIRRKTHLIKSEIDPSD